MAVFPTGEAFYGTSGVDTFKGGVGSDIFHMTADNFVTDSINGDFGADTVDYGASSVGVTITLTIRAPSAELLGARSRRSSRWTSTTLGRTATYPAFIIRSSRTSRASRSHRLKP